MARAMSSDIEPEMAVSDESGIKAGAKILLVGHNGVGKSSLINKLLGEKVAKVGTAMLPTKHHSVERHQCTVGDVPLEIYDTRGFGDPGMSEGEIIKSIVYGMKSTDLVLFCHPLYGRVDTTTETLLTGMLLFLGKDLMKNVVFVFTKGDHYKIQYDDDESDEDEINKDEKDKEYARKMNAQKQQLEHCLRQMLLSFDKTLTSEITDAIPSCITGKKLRLPTSDNWVHDLWQICEERCSAEAKPFVNKMKVKILSMAVGIGAATGAATGLLMGAVTGATAGALVGSAVPGVGTIVGGVVGGIIGGVGGGVGGGAALGGAGAGVGAGVGILINKDIEKSAEKKLQLTAD